MNKFIQNLNEKDIDFSHTTNYLETDSVLSHISSISKVIDFFKEYGDKDLIKNKLIKSNDDYESLLSLIQLFKENPRSLYRKNEKSKYTLCVYWQSKVNEIANEIIDLNLINEFKGIDRDFLRSISKLSKDPNNLIMIPKVLAEKGIILIYKKSLPGMKLDGLLYLKDTHPIIGLSFRYSRIDYFWFTLLHELAHIVLHYEDLIDIHTYDKNDKDINLDEKKADRLAIESLIPRREIRGSGLNIFSEDNEVIAFAESIGIHPAIVAGQLQKKYNNFSKFRKIVDEVNIRDKVFYE